MRDTAGNRRYCRIPKRPLNGNVYLISQLMRYSNLRNSHDRLITIFDDIMMDINLEKSRIKNIELEGMEFECKGSWAMYRE